MLLECLEKCHKIVYLSCHRKFSSVILNKECWILSGFTSLKIYIVITNKFYYFVNCSNINRVSIYRPKSLDVVTLKGLPMIYLRYNSNTIITVFSICTGNFFLRSRYWPSLWGWCDGQGQYSRYRSKKQLLLYLLSKYVQIPGPLSEILTIANLPHAASRVWTCTEPKFRLSWIMLCSSDNHYTAARERVEESWRWEKTTSLTSFWLNLNSFHSLFWYFHCWLWTIKCRLGSRLLFVYNFK